MRRSVRIFSSRSLDALGSERTKIASHRLVKEQCCCDRRKKRGSCGGDWWQTYISWQAERQTARLINASLRNSFHGSSKPSFYLLASISRSHRGHTANLEVSWSIKRGRVFGQEDESIIGHLQMNVESDISFVPFTYILSSIIYKT